jgi:hypothetical protein
MCVIPREIRELIERFRRNREAYKGPQCNETHVRRELIDPLFKAPGWDVDNVQGCAETYKDLESSFQEQIDATDRQACPDAGRIDEVVYQFYALTDEKIRIVQVATGR